jgi:hypothetical protein
MANARVLRGKHDESVLGFLYLAQAYEVHCQHPMQLRNVGCVSQSAPRVLNTIGIVPIAQACHRQLLVEVVPHRVAWAHAQGVVEMRNGLARRRLARFDRDRVGGGVTLGVTPISANLKN